VAEPGHDGCPHQPSPLPIHAFTGGGLRWGECICEGGFEVESGLGLKPAVTL